MSIERHVSTEGAELRSRLKEERKVIPSGENPDDRLDKEMAGGRISSEREPRLEKGAIFVSEVIKGLGGKSSPKDVSEAMRFIRDVKRVVEAASRVGWSIYSKLTGKTFGSGDVTLTREGAETLKILEDKIEELQNDDQTDGSQPPAGDQELSPEIPPINQGSPFSSAPPGTPKSGLVGEIVGKGPGPAETPTETGEPAGPAVEGSGSAEAKTETEEPAEPAVEGSGSAEAKTETEEPAEPAVEGPGSAEAKTETVEPAESAVEGSGPAEAKTETVEPAEPATETEEEGATVGSEDVEGGAEIKPPTRTEMMPRSFDGSEVDEGRNNSRAKAENLKKEEKEALETLESSIRNSESFEDLKNIIEINSELVERVTGIDDVDFIMLVAEIESFVGKIDKNKNRNVSNLIKKIPPIKLGLKKRVHQLFVEAEKRAGTEASGEEEENPYADFENPTLEEDGKYLKSNAELRAAFEEFLEADEDKNKYKKRFGRPDELTERNRQIIEKRYRDATKEYKDSIWSNSKLYADQQLSVLEKPELRMRIQHKELTAKQASALKDYLDKSGMKYESGRFAYEDYLTPSAIKFLLEHKDDEIRLGTLAGGLDDKELSRRLKKVSKGKGTEGQIIKYIVDDKILQHSMLRKEKMAERSAKSQRPTAYIEGYYPERSSFFGALFKKLLT